MKNLSASQKRLGFKIHAISFVVAMVVQVIINLLIGPPYWVVWVFLGWGVGLLAHWVFGRGQLPDKP